MSSIWNVFLLDGPLRMICFWLCLCCLLRGNQLANRWFHTSVSRGHLHAQRKCKAERKVSLLLWCCSKTQVSVNATQRKPPRVPRSPWRKTLSGCPHRARPLNFPLVRPPLHLLLLCSSAHRSTQHDSGRIIGVDFVDTLDTEVSLPMCHCVDRSRCHGGR